jgi:predicted HTH transcriptional regulator
MDIPADLYAWTFDTIAAIVEQHEFEPGRFDYKTVLNPTLAEGRDDHLISIRRATVSMANGSGGYILFGVRDRNMKVAAPRDRIVGIPIASDLRKEFGDKLHTIERDIF